MHLKYLHFAASAAVLASASLAHPAHAARPSSRGSWVGSQWNQSGRITRSSFGTTKGGQDAELFTLTNARGMTVKITSYGGTVTSISVPDRRGQKGDVVLGFRTLAEYEKSSPYFGALIGRFANRIAKGRFTLDGKSYTLATNNGPNHLHGGKVGFDKKVWSARPLMTSRGPALELRLFSPAGEEGYPGNLNVLVTYTLTPDNTLRIVYRAATDKATVINLTNHSYFNLKGAGMGDILGHRLTIFGSRFLPTDSTAIPTGEKRRVRGTPFDFLRPHAIGERIGANEQQLKFGKGYDHNFILDHARGRLGLTARAYEPTTGRVLTMYTTEPGVQLYTGNFLSKMAGQYGRFYNYRGAFCLEAQDFPDAPNQPGFPSPVLRPGHTYRQTTVYQFSTR